jgi:hypothetical protein
LDPLDRLAFDRSTGEPEAFPPDAPLLPLLAALPAWWRLSHKTQKRNRNELNDSFRMDATCKWLLILNNNSQTHLFTFGPH